MNDGRVVASDHRTRAGIVPASHEELESFLSEYDDSPAFRIEYVDDDGDHEHELVWLNACWALGHLVAEGGRDRLEELRGDDDQRVRNRTAWAIAEIEG